MNRAGLPISMFLALLLPHALGSCGGGSTSEAGPPDGVRSADEARATEPDSYEFQFEAPREIVTRDDAFRVTWRPENGRVPINEHFSVDVTLVRNDAERTPVEGASVTISCFMPDHGHGMLREPRSEELGEGKYRVNGFLLHMDGYWTVAVNVLVDGLAATAEDELRL
ncbi:FixH family protein [Saltatorellus ferox]